ncbi:MAG: DUF4493 domain-containing protein [Bacteroidales bacterium]|nr:DUF4493 domain-containing protein [Bacteroidales bacterium]
MKKLLHLLPLCAALLLPPSCQDLTRQTREGRLILSLTAPGATGTRSDSPSPDIGTFLLTVTDENGNVLYEGTFADSPETFDIPAGNYTVSAVSAPFSAPAYDSPQWGDTRVVSVAAGSAVAVNLVCGQTNSGLHLDIDKSFRNAFPNGRLTLKGAEGSLEHPYDETRTAYFKPGPVSVLLEDGGYVQGLFSRNLEACQILSVHVSANVEALSGGISLQLDTTRTYISEDYRFGDRGGNSVEDACDVGTARTRAGDKGVWVCGYIVGVATGTGKIGFTPPFAKNTNLVLGERATTGDKDHCLSVELRSGPIREALNLQDHPELKGRKVYIKGDLVSAYYGIPGLKAPSDWQLPD